MQCHWRQLILILIGLISFSSAMAQENPLATLDWQFGPTEGQIGDRAKIHVPDGYVFLDSQDTKKLMELMENMPGENEYVFGADNLSWFAVFHFNPVGYVKDNDALDAQSLLDAVRQGNEQGNMERRKRGWRTMTILGWRFQPRYDEANNLLEWAFLAQDDATKQEIVNYNTRLLGRNGVMQVVLVTQPDTLDSSVVAFKQAISKYSFVSGERYADYRNGDRVAEFGLAALVAGGAAAVATKKGFWAILAGFFAVAWKFVAAAVIGVLAWVASLFKRKS